MNRLRFALFAAALFVPLSAWATVVLALSMEELTARAHLVVHATVHRSEADWDEAHSRIWTWTELVVKDTLKGTPSATVLVKQPGGTVGIAALNVSGVATFSPGEEVVVFLEPAPDEAGTWVPVSMSASKVSLEERFGAKLARRDLSGLAFAYPGKKGVVQPVDERETLGTASAFLSRIRSAAMRGGR